MGIQQTLFEQLKYEILNLIDENQKLKLKLKEKENVLKDLLDETKMKNSELKKLSAKIELQEMTQAINGSSEMNSKMNAKLDDLIQDVDDCIKQLKK